MVRSKRFTVVFFLALFLCAQARAALADAPGAVEFSGMVKKVILKKSKVAITDPKTKKRFTLVVNDQTKLNGWAKLEDIKKKDPIRGKYIVTPKGAYVALELNKE